MSLTKVITTIIDGVPTNSVNAYGAVGDGTTNDSAEINLAATSSTGINGGSGQTYLCNTAVTLGTTSKVQSLKLSTTTSLAEFLLTPANSTGVTLRDIEITGNSLAAFNENRVSCTNTSILNPRITATGVAILSNEQSDGSSNFYVIGGYLNSEADTVLFNHPGGEAPQPPSFSTNFNYNLITTVMSSTAGVAAQVSGTRGWKFIANHVTNAGGTAAFRCEHSQTKGIIALNTGAAITNNGVELSPPLEVDVNAGIYAEPVVVLGNHLEHLSGGTAGKSGIAVPSTVPGVSTSLGGNTIIGNVVKNFDYGILTNDKPLYASGNVLRNAAVGVVVTRSGIQYGENLADGCTTLVEVNSAAIAGKVVSLYKPTNVASFGDGVRICGGMMKGFAFPVTFTSGGTSGAGKKVDLFAIASSYRVAGRLSILWDQGGAASGVMYSADVTWDGTTLTSANVISDSGGAVLSSFSFVDNSNQLAFQYTTANNLTAETLNVNFDGVYYVS
jgi:hypothetical protein